MMKKMKSIALAVLLCAIFLIGCTQSLEADSNTVFVGKNGKVISVDVGVLDQNYYDEAGLQAFVDDAVNAYNAGKDDEAVKVQELVVTGGNAKLKMQYKTVADYVAFNGIELYQGTVAEAVEAGYGFDVDFVKVVEGAEFGASSKEEIYGLDKVKVVVIRARNIDVKVDGEILFVSSEDVELLGTDTISIKKGNWLGNRPEPEATEAVESIEDTEMAETTEEVEATEAVEDATEEVFETEAEEVPVEQEYVNNDSFETDVYTYIIYK